MLSSGHALVTDFGVAKALGIGGSGHELAIEGAGLTSVGIALGTPTYMSPEQAAADPHVDHRSDLYALGVMGYEMLAGQPPFVAPTAQALIAAHFTREPESLRVNRPTVPESFDAIILRCLAKRPADRFEQASELLPLLDQIAHRSGTAQVTSATRPETGSATFLKSSLVVIACAAIGTTLWVLRQAIGLPDWLVVVAAVILIIGFPLALRYSRRGRASGPMQGAGGLRGALKAGAVAFLGLGAMSGSFAGLRALGIGPFATLLSAGTISERDKILVAEFGNSTPDTLLGSALTEALSIDISQSKVVRLMSPTEVREWLTRMKVEPSARLTPAVASEVAARAGVKVVIVGDIAPFASGYALSARILDAQGTTLFATRATANGTSDILPALEIVSREVRGKLGESLKSIRGTQSLEQVTTTSLEALQLYTRANRSKTSGDDVDRLSLLRQAVSLDSSFAMAWRGIMAELTNSIGDATARLEAMEKVYRFKDRLPAHEAQQAEGVYAIYQGDHERAIEIYRGIVASWPDDMTAHNSIGLYLRVLGRYADAERELTPIVEAGTAGASSYYNLVTIQIPQERYAAAERTLELMRVRMPKSPMRWQAQYFLASSRYRFDEALTNAESLTTASSVGYRYWAHLYSAEVYGLRGQLRLAERSMQATAQAQRDQRNPGGALRADLWSIWTDLRLRGDTATAKARLEALLRASPTDSLPVNSRPYGEVVRLRAALGQLVEARRVLAEYEKSTPKVLRDGDESMYRALAQLAIAEGRPQEAIPLARKGALGCFGCTGDLIGEAYEKLGIVDSAIAAYEAALRPPTYGSDYQNWRPVVVPRAMFKLGELYESQGAQQKARDRYAAFVDLWQQADPALQPAVQVARGRLTSLTGAR